MNELDIRETSLEFMPAQIEELSVQQTPRVCEADAALTVSDGEEIIDLTGSFDIDEFQVVRREFFAHLREPSITFNDCKFSVNAACLAKFPETEYVQVLINPQTKTLALWPCEEGAKDAFQWCSISKGKRKPKATTCKLFFAKVVDMMGWNPHYKYKLLGRLVCANNAYLLVFDLTATEVYQKAATEGARPRTSRTPVFPIGWQNQFGLPFSEHRQSMQINVVDGYAVYTIKERTNKEAGIPSVLHQPYQNNPSPSAHMIGGL